MAVIKYVGSKSRIAKHIVPIIQSYIDRVEEETLSSYPLVIEKESVDMSAMLETFAGEQGKNNHNDDKIHSINTNIL